MESNNVVKIKEDIVITKDKYDMTVPFVDGYVLIKHNKQGDLTNAEALYYLELAAHKLKDSLIY